MPIFGVFLSFLFGFLPMLFFAYIVYWTDRYEKEPKKMLGGVFLWGAIIAAGAAFIINTSFGLGLYLFSRSQALSEQSTSSLIAPITEEILKGVAVLFVFLYFRREFDSIVDGIVYAAITALGFAATENVYYIYTYGFKEAGISGIFGMFFLRVFLVGWQHPFYTAFIGIGLAIARLNPIKAVKIIGPILGLGVAITVHSIHNTIATTLQGLKGLTTELLFDWSGWVMMVIFLIWALYREQRWIVTQLRDEVSNGTITPAQYHTACSAWRQTGSRINALFSGNYQLVNRFYSLTAELAYKKRQSIIPGEPGHGSTEIDVLRDQLASLSTKVPA
jgi:RsiW-degrading membrane proteinase PrsW (M82 family)